MLRKCPICELNYLRGSETMCRVCAAERAKKHAPESAETETIMCSECGDIFRHANAHIRNVTKQKGETEKDV